MLLRTTPMQQVDIDAATRITRVEAGRLWQDVGLWDDGWLFICETGPGHQELFEFAVRSLIHVPDEIAGGGDHRWVRRLRVAWRLPLRRFGRVRVGMAGVTDNIDRWIGRVPGSRRGSAE
jgi:hypothetical protein